MKTLKKMAHGLIAVAALFLATGCPQPNVTPAEVVEKVTFDPAPESGEISPTDKISLYCETDGVDIYYSVGEELTSENYAEVGTAYNGSFTISEDAIVYAIAVSEKGTCSEVSSFAYTLLKLPSIPELTPSAAADATTKLYARGTTVAISSTSDLAGDEVVIYYSTTEELKSSNAETKGTVYVASGDNATVITINDVTKISAIAKGKNGFSAARTMTFDVPVAYELGAFDFDGNIAAALKAIDGTDGASFGDGITISGYVTNVVNKASSGKPYIYIQDGTDGIQVYGTKTGDSDPTFEVGDFVTVPACTAGEVYTKSGVYEVTAFGTITVDETKVTRNIKFSKIPSYCVDFTPYFGHGTLLYGFRGKVGEHTVSPDNIYAFSSAEKDAERINLGAVVKASGSVQLTLWKQLDVSDDILPVDPVAVEAVTAATSAEATNGYYAAGTVVTLACATEGADIYYSTSAFAQYEFNAENTEKFTKATTYTIADDVVLYTIAVKGTDRSVVKAYEYLTPFEVTYAELTEENNYTLDGKLKSLAESKPTAADDVTYEGILVAVGSNFALVQDKDAGIYIYNLTLPSNARVGSQISFVLTAGKEYNGLYEVTKGTITVTKAKAQSEILYINLTGKDDFTAYTTGQLCGVRGKAADYATEKATVYNKNDDGEEHAYFGNVYNYKGTTIQLQSLFTKDKSVISMGEGFVEPPVFSLSDGVTVNSGTTVEITSETEDAKIYYTLDGTTPTAESTEYSAAISLTETVTIKAIAIKGENSSEVTSASYTVLAAGVTPVVKATLDFTTANATWGIPTEYATDETTFSNGTYEIKLYATNGYKDLGAALIYGKEGAYVSLPAFDWTTTKIVVKGSSGGGAKVTQNIFVGDTAVSTQTTSAKVDHEYDIASAYQAAGNVYVIKVTNANNSQLTAIEIWGY